MQFTLATLVGTVLLFAAMLAAQYGGRRLGESHRALAGADAKSPYGATEGAVFALLGLFFAFTFGGAGTRFDERRHLVIEETNAIGTAWLRIDLLPAGEQPAVRELFREYVDSRIEVYRADATSHRRDEAHRHYRVLQERIWDASVRGARASGETPPAMLLLPALNAMFDITTTRLAVTRIHPPPPVYAMIAFLAIVSAVFIGYAISGAKVRSRVHDWAFAAVLAVVIFVIVDLEFPRLGFIRVDSMDQLLVDLRRTMD